MDVSPAPTPLPPIPPGRAMRSIPQIPDHDIVRQIGSGAYGEVWLAKSLTGAWRAVKIVWRDDFDDDRTFNKEFEGIEHYEPIARNHPGLVHILHVGRKESPDHLYYYVMELGDDAQNGVHINPAEYIPRTLQTDKRLAGGKPLPLDYCLEVGSQLAHSLIYLHSKDLTHRDIKPANVIFVNGRPKLADIGLVALRDQRSFVGTEGFIPPDGPGTKRADVYALAKVLYEISSGKDRMEFPELPDILPSDTPRKKWQHFNNIICAAAEPRVDHCSIMTAEKLAEAIDSLRGYSVHPKFRRPRKKRPMKGTTKLLLSAGAGACIALVAMVILSGNLAGNRQQESPLQIAPVDTKPHPSTHKSPEKSGYVFISSVPSGASIYDSSGHYLDETPYGPLPLKAGQNISYILKKEGFADWTISGTVPPDETLALGGDLKPFTPPKEGTNWTDASGMIYLPEGAIHESETPLTDDCFGQFINTDKSAQTLPYRVVTESSRKHAPSIIMTSKEGIAAYLSWLRNRCENAGILNKEYTISAKEIPGYSEDNDQLKAYRLTVGKTHYVPITIRTEPSGATIYLNGQPIGKTPLKDYSTPQAPYSIDIKLPGFAPINRSGLDPLNLDLSLQLEKDHSVIFDQPWTNDLSMDFIPLSKNLLAQSHEVRLKDYRQFTQETGTKEVPKAPFEQGDDHPVVNVSRIEAEQFALWLTDRDRKRHLIESSDTYRLPTDEEWSLMAGGNQEPKALGSPPSPYEKSLKAAKRPSMYFWGDHWPPKDNIGNFADISAIDHLPSSRLIVNYNDQAPYTAPVKSYAPNEKGFFDIDGNVQEWTSDTFGGPNTFKFRNDAVVRGGSYVSFRPNQLEQSTRTPLSPDKSSPTIGFRLVLVREVEEKEPSSR